MKKYLFLLLLFGVTIVRAQTIISGQVIDEKTKETLPGVSVYVNNTTIGTTTDQNGKFSLSVSLTGKIEVVASYISYKKKVTILEDYNGKMITIELKSEDNTLNEVVIKGTKGDNYDKWGSLFSKMLLANTHSPGSCTIKNPDVMVFYFNKEQNQLMAYARAPLIVENNNLGYVLKLDLEEFNYDFGTDILMAKYYIFFEEMKSPKIGTEAVLKQRNLAYYGSQMHFMRSLYENTLTRNGFKVYQFKSIKNSEKERVTKLVQQRINKDSKIKSSVTYDLNKLFQPRDTAEYYKLIMSQNDILSADTTLTAMRRYAKLDRVNDIVTFNTHDSLMVNYQQYLDRYNKIITPEQKADWKLQNENKRFKGKNTIMYFAEDGGINVQSSGYYPELRLYYQGDMFERRVAQLLPWDYKPS